MAALPLLLLAALAAGVSVGVLWMPPARLTVPALVVSAGVNLWATPGRARTALAAGLLAILAAGAALASDAERAARRPPLAAQALGSADSALISLHGPLTMDAAPGANGVRLRVRPAAVNGDPASGGGEIALTVLGALAPDQVEAWRAGRLVELPARVRRPARYLNDGVPDHRLDLARRGLLLVGSVKSGLLVERLADGTAFAETAAAVRAHVRRVLTRHVGAVDETAAAIAVAILIGDRAALDSDLEERLQAAGTYHVLAISGGNIALLTALLLAATRAAGLRGGRQALLAGGALAAHAALVGAGPSVTRATLMALVYLLLSALDARAWTLAALAAAAGAMLVARPLSLVDPGFVLSVGATGAIVALTPALLARVPRGAWWLPAAAVVAASAASELVLLPASATFFNRVTAAGLLLNLFAVPLMGVVQCAAMLLLAVEPISEAAANLTGWIVAMAARGLVDSSQLVEIWPSLARRVPAPAAWAAILYIAALGACFANRLLDPLPGRWRWRMRRAAPLVTAAAALWLLLAPATWAWPWRDPGVLRVTFLDVGQGDATLVELPGGGRWLVDAGGLPGSRTFDIGARVVAPALWARGVGRLEALVLTHGDPDHTGGAGSVLGDFTPRAVWEGVPVPAHALLRGLREQADRVGSGWTQVRAGVRHAHGAAGIDVWHPPPPDWERQRVRNDDSIVLEIRFGDVSVVLPGDIGDEIERAVAPRLPPARLRILKAAHHGGRSSSGEEWLDALRPAVAVVSCGRDNPYGHPAPPVLERLQRRGIGIYRTDEDGAVTIETDGTEVEIRTFTGRAQRLP